MDPFLEHPFFFPGLHGDLITGIKGYLQSRLPEPYYVDSQDRAEVELTQRPIEPDITVLRAEVPTPAPAESVGNGSVATATTTGTITATKPLVVTVPSVLLRETYLEIYARQETERLVTSIEILSRSNKTTGERMQTLYRRKQQEILKSQINLVEIDLLRTGQHSTAVPLSNLAALSGPFHYHVCVWQFDQHEDYNVYPFILADRLPTIAIPLLPGDPPVLLDLQTVFNQAYEIGPYRRRVPYARLDLVPPLAEPWLEWVRERLRTAGLLPRPEPTPPTT
jgi:hypothetical protein